MKKLFPAVLCLLLPVTVFAQQNAPIGPSSGGGLVASSASIPNYTANGGLPKWQACRAKVKANTANCRVLMIGDSTTQGQDGSFDGVANDGHQFSIPNELASDLGLYGINASGASLIGGGNLANIGILAAFDTRITANNWSLAVCTGGPCVNKQFIQNTDTSAFIFAPQDSAASFPSNVLQTDTLEVIGIGYSGASTLNVNQNGGSTLGSVNFNTGSNQIVKGIITGTLSAGPWEHVCASASTGACIITSLRAYNSAVSEASIMNLGWSGAHVTDWANTGATPFDPISYINFVAPDFCVIDLTINDAHDGTATATYTADFQAIINACKNSGDVLIVTGNPTQPATTTYANQLIYVNLAKALATTNNVPILDMWTNLCGTLSGSTCPRGGWLFGMGAALNGGFMAAADPYHMSVAGYQLYATFIAQILSQ